jgi:hypothetical protein
VNRPCGAELSDSSFLRLPLAWSNRILTDGFAQGGPALTVMDNLVPCHNYSVVSRWVQSLIKSSSVNGWSDKIQFNINWYAATYSTRHINGSFVALQSVSVYEGF